MEHRACFGVWRPPAERSSSGRGGPSGKTPPILSLIFAAMNGHSGHFQGGAVNGAVAARPCLLGGRGLLPLGWGAGPGTLRSRLVTHGLRFCGRRPTARAQRRRDRRAPPQSTRCPSVPAAVPGAGRGGARAELRGRPCPSSRAPEPVSAARAPYRGLRGRAHPEAGGTGQPPGVTGGVGAEIPGRGQDAPTQGPKLAAGGSARAVARHREVAPWAASPGAPGGPQPPALPTGTTRRPVGARGETARRPEGRPLRDPGRRPSPGSPGHDTVSKGTTWVQARVARLDPSARKASGGVRAPRGEHSLVRGGDAAAAPAGGGEGRSPRGGPTYAPPQARPVTHRPCAARRQSAAS